MATIESINELLNEAAERLDQAATEIHDLPLQPSKDYIRLIGEALANIFEIQQQIYEKEPNLRPEYLEEQEDEEDPGLSDEELALVEALSTEEIERIDNAIISHVVERWRKVAMVVGLTMMEFENRPKGIPDIFYAQRVKKLVENGALEADGNLDYMRYSEVRLPSTAQQKT